jgi:hypothetical protein
MLKTSKVKHQFCSSVTFARAEKATEIQSWASDSEELYARFEDNPVAIAAICSFFYCRRTR